MASLPDTATQSRLFLEEHGIQGEVDYIDNPAPHQHLHLWLVGHPQPLVVPVATWQAWLDSRGWGDL